MNTPIALIIFNRPDHTEKVFSQIAKVKPSKLLVIADGPRAGYPHDLQDCDAARSIIDRVDWDCDLYKNYSDVNLGCGRRPATGISWVFELVDNAIILEDDIIPHPTFFPYCEELLERFQDDQRVMSIAGMSSQFGEKGTMYNAYSYGFRRAISGWGWATWRRAWEHYDYHIKSWPILRDTNWLEDITRNPLATQFYKRIFDRAYEDNGNITFWDYQWLFTCWLQNGLCVVPNAHLTMNIGFGEKSTHTKAPPQLAPTSLEEMTFPLNHPPFMLRDFEADVHRYHLRHSQKGKNRSWNSRLKEIFRRIQKKLFW